jgi:hypothetical protein
MIQRSNRIHEYPPIIERLCPRTNYYNFNIVETEKKWEDSDETYLNYDYEQIIVDNPVTREKLVDLMSVVGLDSQEYIDMVNKDCDDLGI